MPPWLVPVRSKSNQNGAISGGETSGNSLGGQQFVKGVSKDKTPLEFTCRENVHGLLIGDHANTNLIVKN